ncbi:hypothetical protein Poli38472_012189 [Pythium oligandrum]|uniref:Uncharacterized protein n=1 Tax=Pythium oligandrum TaxID=41045 RepID=A0A8K1CRM7_PYTOL|nr:hypothetical protein Poli38472_012189 [Pythium oligandrum]|eukprot:TMW67073.1 hypothetical protein Poli38472_012189 [Pythium oligandrum]
MITHGEIVQIAEVLRSPQLQNRSVRVTGRLESFDAARNLAVISFQGARMTVETNTMAMDGREMTVGSMYQFLGETHRIGGGPDDVRLRARVLRNVDNMDIDLFLQALELRRQFLAAQ